jgi:alkylation response protein AidB-like acyl-CoA dehydrogenase
MDRMMQLEIELTTLELTALRILTDENGPGPQASMLKIRGTEIGQALFELLMQAMGPDSRAHVPDALDLGYEGPRAGSDDAATAAGDYFNMRKLSIFGGSNEIQRNIIAQLVLSL